MSAIVPPDAVWTTRSPKAAGVYLWRKNARWEPVARNVWASGPDATLVAFSHRYAQQVPLVRLGGEWFLSPRA